ncbi:MAG: TonB-dependent receptor [Bacteroidaceae bacterium]|nr:TonB-dependent receptor [Bacteroidaceae bacterium]
MFKTKCFLHVFCVLLLGFNRLSAQDADTLLHYNLLELEVVTDIPVPEIVSSVPQRIMDKKDFLRLGAFSIADVAKSLVGVDIRDYGGVGGLKTISVRGLGAKHTAVSYDGMMISDTQSGLVDIGRFSLDNISLLSMEIGQGDDIFKTAREFASAGTLSLKSFKPQKTSFHARVGGGSFGLLDAALRQELCFANRWAVSLNANILHSNGGYPFTLVNGETVTRERRVNSDVNSLSYEGNVYGVFCGGDLRLKLYGYNSERGLPGAVNLYNKDNKERLWDDNFFVQAKYELPLYCGITVKSALKYNYQFSEYNEWSSNYANGVQVDKNTQNELYGTLGVLCSPFSAFSIALTGDFSYSVLENNFEQSKAPRRFSSYTVFAAQYNNKVISATASLLGTWVRDEVENVASLPAPYRSLSPSLAFSYKPFFYLPLRLRLSFKQNYRIPTFADLYYLRLGNVNLKPERALQTNFGVTWGGAVAVFDDLTFTVDAYYNKVYDKIVALPTMYVWRMMNFGEADIAGIDVTLSASVDLLKDVSLVADIGYSYMYAVDVTDSSAKNYRHQLPYTPEHSGKLILSFLNPWVNISYTMMAVGERYMLPQNTTRNKMNGYIDHSFTLNHEFNFRKLSLRMQGELLNVSDNNYEVIANYPMPGFSWRLSATILF